MTDRSIFILNMKVDALNKNLSKMAAYIYQFFQKEFVS